MNIERPYDRARAGSTDLIDNYLADAADFPRLPQDEILRLCVLAQRGKFIEKKLAADPNYPASPEEQATVSQGVKARNQVMEANLGLVISVAKKLRYCAGVPFLDLIQEGNLGLEKAVYKFDHEMGCQFSTYATFWIKQGISRHICAQGRSSITLPVSASQDLSKIINHLTSANPKPDLSIGAIHEQTKISLKKIRALLPLAKGACSLDKEIQTGSDQTLGDNLTETGAEIETVTLTALENEQINNALTCLTEREKMVVYYRYCCGETLEEIAAKTENTQKPGQHITREGVRLILVNALGKMKTELVSTY